MTSGLIEDPCSIAPLGPERSSDDVDDVANLALSFSDVPFTTSPRVGTKWSTLTGTGQGSDKCYELQPSGHARLLTTAVRSSMEDAVLP